MRDLFASARLRKAESKKGNSLGSMRSEDCHLHGLLFFLLPHASDPALPEAVPV